MTNVWRNYTKHSIPVERFPDHKDSLTDIAATLITCYSLGILEKKRNVIWMSLLMR